MKIFKILTTTVAFFLCSHLLAAENGKKSLFFIFLTGETEVDKIHKKAWERCFEDFREDFEVRYVKTDSSNETSPFLLENLIDLKKPKNYKRQKCWGLIGCLALFKDRLDDFDFVIKADVRTFLVISKLKEALKMREEKNVYLGNVSHHEDLNGKWSYVEASFQVFSKEVAKSLAGSYLFMEALGKSKYQDENILIGAIMNKMGVKPHHVFCQPIQRCVRPYKLLSRMDKSTFVFHVDLVLGTTNPLEREKILRSELYEIFYS
ncbi:MAG: hypothetical protein FJZ62_05350 [Chlamydiae bacterium]|nr:hypothetical protein [Chlamydiota bacterium]